MGVNIQNIPNGLLPPTDPLARPATFMEMVLGSSSYYLDQLVAVAMSEYSDINTAGFAYNGAWYQAYGDVLEFANGAITAASPNISTVSYQFTAADIGKKITIKAGLSGGGTLNTTIINAVAGVGVMNNNATATSGAVGFMFGHDDTAAINAAWLLSKANAYRPARTIKVPSGRYFISGQIEMYYGGSMIGSSRSAVKFQAYPTWLPGTGAMQYFFHSGQGMGHLTLNGFTIDGSRDYYPTVQNLGGLGIDDFNYAFGGGYNNVGNIAIQNIKGTAYFHAGGGENYIWNISGDIGSQLGFVFNTYDSHLMNMSFGGFTQTAVQLNGSCAGNRWTNIKAWYSGGASYPTMVCDGQTQVFDNLTIEESCGVGLQIQGTRSRFQVVLYDIGDVRYVNGNGGTNPVANRAAIQIDGQYTARDGGIENYIDGYVCPSVRNTMVYATSALRLINLAGKNVGTIVSSPKQLSLPNPTGGLTPGYAIAAVEIISSAGNNNLVVDGVTVN